MSGQNSFHANETLRRAFEEVEARRIRAIEAQGYTPFESSPRYRRFIAKLAKRVEHNRLTVSAKKRVLTAIVAALLILGTLMSVSAVRQTILDFFTEVVDGWLYVRIDDKVLQDAPYTLETVYVPSYQPEGYRFEKKEIYKTLSSFCWTNEEGDLMNFSQATLHGDHFTKADTATELYINDMRVLRQEREGYCSYYWRADEYSFLVSFRSHIPVEEIEKIINSLVVLEEQ